jgi:hypothetical protein
MKKMIESITGGYVSSAKVVDGALIISLPDAVSPVVWRMDLGSVKSSALEVRDQKDGSFMLTLKTPNNDLQEIAPFAEKAVAVRALMAVSSALENGQNAYGARSSSSLMAGEIQTLPPQGPQVVYKSDGSVAKWVSGIAAVLVLVILLSIMVHQTPRTSTFDNAASATAAALPHSMSMDQSANQTGVPVSADDFLREHSKQQ